MKKCYTLGLIAALSLVANARQLSPEEAISRVSHNQGLAKISALIAKSVKPALTVRRGTFTSLYVFNTGERGYMILSADDCAVPMLGYSDSDSFDTENIPAQLQGWLDFYASEIQFAANSQSPRKAVNETRPYRAPIEPLTKSKWNQGAPYNDDCPLDNGKRSVTGCVATAMAQVMYYHQWPVTGTGTKSYDWEVGDSTLTVDYANTTFDWADMTDTYNKESTAAQKAAVAELMYACGVSVNMHYTSGESGSAPIKIGEAINKYFRYSANCSYPQRYFYSLIDWENLVYDQLEQGLPVLYNGQGSIGGHEFVCDGYSSDGYFHFNWGWSGMSDGYYLLSALDPMEQGIGGNLTGFDYEQGIWINVKPESASDSTETVSPLIYSYGNFATTAKGSVELGTEVTFEASKNFMNFTYQTQTGELGIEIVADGDTTYVAHNGTVDIPFYNSRHSFTVTLPSDLTDGTYTVTPAFKSESTGEWTPVLCSLSGVQALTMTIADGKASFVSSDPAAVEITSLTQNTPFYFGSKFSVTVDFTNPGTEDYYGELMLALTDANGTRVDNALMSEALNLAAGESTSVDIVSDFPLVNDKDTVQAGDYYLQVYEYMTGNILYTSTSTVSISKAPKTELSIENLTAISEIETTAGKTDVHFTGVVECTEGYFSGQLQVRVYKKGASDTSAKAKTDYIFADLNEKTTFTVTAVLPDAKSGEEYYAEMYWNDAQIGDEKYPFTINFEMSEIDGVSIGDGISITPHGGYIEINSPEAIENVRVYSVTGEEILQEKGVSNIYTSSFTSGVYLISATDTSGATITSKILIH